MNAFNYRMLLVLSIMTTISSPSTVRAERPGMLVIAHRGASGYLPEHSEGAKVLAVAQGADIVEQDVVLCKDGVFVVSHDLTMDATTNIKDIYPSRRRKDGRFYWADFTWAELKLVSLRERSLGNPRSKRFPHQTETRVVSLDDEIRLVRGLNEVLNRNVGFHIELKEPAWHREQFGERMGAKLMEVLRKNQVSPENELCFIQCFEAEELIYLHDELKCPYPLVQLHGGRPLGLVDAPEGRDRLQTLIDELPAIARYAAGIGPAIAMLIKSEGGGVASTGFVEASHRLGLVVHPYTVRSDMLPVWAANVDQLHTVLVDQLKVDGFFTDFPDLAVQFRDKR
jgi:glycerophosphoryl diester phosphodiesterase